MWVHQHLGGTEDPWGLALTKTAITTRAQVLALIWASYLPYQSLANHNPSPHVYGLNHDLIGAPAYYHCHSIPHTSKNSPVISNVYPLI